MGVSKCKALHPLEKHAVAFECSFLGLVLPAARFAARIHHRGPLSILEAPQLYLRAIKLVHLLRLWMYRNGKLRSVLALTLKRTWWNWTVIAPLALTLVIFVVFSIIYICIN